MIYEMYDPKDESTRPETLPKGCEAYIFHADEWAVERDSPDRWKHCLRRWPAQEQRPTAYGLLTDDERESFRNARNAGRLERLGGQGFEPVRPTSCLDEVYTYRIKPEPTVEIIVKVNGKLVDPTTLSTESWAALRKES